jgi:hypothetical protein
VEKQKYLIKMAKEEAIRIYEMKSVMRPPIIIINASQTASAQLPRTTANLKEFGLRIRKPRKPKEEEEKEEEEEIKHDTVKCACGVMAHTCDKCCKKRKPETKVNMEFDHDLVKGEKAACCSLLLTVVLFLCVCLIAGFALQSVRMFVDSAPALKQFQILKQRNKRENPPPLEPFEGSGTEELNVSCLNAQVVVIPMECVVEDLFCVKFMSQVCVCKIGLYTAVCNETIKTLTLGLHPVTMAVPVQYGLSVVGFSYSVTTEYTPEFMEFCAQTGHAVCVNVNYTASCCYVDDQIVYTNYTALYFKPDNYVIDVWLDTPHVCALSGDAFGYWPYRSIAGYPCSPMPMDYGDKMQVHAAAFQGIDVDTLIDHLSVTGPTLVNDLLQCCVMNAGRETEVWDYTRWEDNRVIAFSGKWFKGPGKYLTGDIWMTRYLSWQIFLGQSEGYLASGVCDGFGHGETWFDNIGAAGGPECAGIWFDPTGIPIDRGNLSGLYYGLSEGYTTKSPIPIITFGTETLKDADGHILPSMKCAENTRCVLFGEGLYTARHKQHVVVETIPVSTATIINDVGYAAGDNITYRTPVYFPPEISAPGWEKYVTTELHSHGAYLDGGTTYDVVHDGIHTPVQTECDYIHEVAHKGACLPILKNPHYPTEVNNITTVWRPGFMTPGLSHKQKVGYQGGLYSTRTQETDLILSFRPIAVDISSATVTGFATKDEIVLNMIRGRYAYVHVICGEGKPAKTVELVFAKPKQNVSCDDVYRHVYIYDMYLKKFSSFTLPGLAEPRSKNVAELGAHAYASKMVFGCFMILLIGVSVFLFKWVWIFLLNCLLWLLVLGLNLVFSLSRFIFRVFKVTPSTNNGRRDMVACLYNSKLPPAPDKSALKLGRQVAIPLHDSVNLPTVHRFSRNKNRAPVFPHFIVIIAVCGLLYDLPYTTGYHTFLSDNETVIPPQYEKLKFDFSKHGNTIVPEGHSTTVKNIHGDTAQLVFKWKGYMRDGTVFQFKKLEGANLTEDMFIQVDVGASIITDDRGVFGPNKPLVHHQCQDKVLFWKTLSNGNNIDVSKLKCKTTKQHRHRKTSSCCNGETQIESAVCPEFDGAKHMDVINCADMVTFSSELSFHRFGAGHDNEVKITSIEPEASTDGLKVTGHAFSEPTLSGRSICQGSNIKGTVKLPTAHTLAPPGFIGDFWCFDRGMNRSNFMQYECRGSMPLTNYHYTCAIFRNGISVQATELTGYKMLHQALIDDGCDMLRCESYTLGTRGELAIHGYKPYVELDIEMEAKIEPVGPPPPDFAEFSVHCEEGVAGSAKGAYCDVSVLNKGMLSYSCDVEPAATHGGYAGIKSLSFVVEPGHNNYTGVVRLGSAYLEEKYSLVLEPSGLTTEVTAHFRMEHIVQPEEGDHYTYGRICTFGANFGAWISHWFQIFNIHWTAWLIFIGLAILYVIICYKVWFRNWVPYVHSDTVYPRPKVDSDDKLVTEGVLFITFNRQKWVAITAVAAIGAAFWMYFLITATTKLAPACHQWAS